MFVIKSACTKITTVSERVSSFLIAHQHIKGHFITLSCHRGENDNQGYTFKNI